MTDAHYAELMGAWVEGHAHELNQRRESDPAKTAELQQGLYSWAGAAEVSASEQHERSIFLLERFIRDEALDMKTVLAAWGK